jgi:TolB-like protein
LHRKLKDLTGQSASQIIKEFRLKKAMEMLQNNVATSSEISYQVGFGSPSYFNTCFREYYGYPPGKVKRKRSFKKTRRRTISRSYLFASIAILVVLALIVLNIIPRLNRKELLDKSIAVLPFKNDSPDKETSFINGTMEEILNNLSKIEDLKVVSRNSVEKYRNSLMQTPDIAKELNVSYLLGGSGQREGDKIRLSVQLLDGRNDKQIWTGSYIREIEDIIVLQSEIAQKIAKEINVVITPIEKQLIEKISTSNIQALDYYRKGREEFLQYWIDNENREALSNAEVLYNLALESDSTFAQVYVGLAQVYSYKDYWATYWTEDFLDSAQTMADKALLFDSQLSDAYVIRGDYYREKNQPSNAIIEFDKAIKLNPNNWAAYAGKGRMHSMDDYIQCIYNLQTATTLNLGPELPFLSDHLVQLS